MNPTPRHLNDGFVCLDKPAGSSSAQIVRAVKRALDGAKVGHLGTLDPFATGLLVCASGRATRLADFLSRGIKEYEGSFAIGLRTSTDDITGEVLKREERVVSAGDVEGAVRHFSGPLEQVPPQVSAVHVDGTRAYRLARGGKEFVLDPRSVFVEIGAFSQIDETQFRFHIRTSAGFYVRAWARDIGDFLGCGAALLSLRRTVSEPFRLSEAVALETLNAGSLMPWHTPFAHLDSIETSFEELCGLSRGDERAVARLARRAPSSELAMYTFENAPCGILRQREGKWSLGLHVQGGVQCRH